VISRVEDKYAISNTNKDLIVDALSEKGIILIKTDTYRISSVYYDTADLTFAEQNLLGISPRKKYRIRMYADENSGVNIFSKDFFCEEKNKIANQISKNRISCQSKDCISINEFLTQDARANTLFHSRFASQFPLLMNCTPAMLTSYVRSRYSVLGSFDEITIDSNLSFTHPDNVSNPVKNDNLSIVEHKYNKSSNLKVGASLKNYAVRSRFSKYLYGLNCFGLLTEY
jgi:SPX domain protein involved in polyphosphate accumulation